MSGDNGTKVIAILVILAIIAGAYIWYTGGSLSLGGGRSGYQPPSGISLMGTGDGGGGGGGKKSSGTDYGTLLLLLSGGGLLTGLGIGTGYYVLQGRTLTLSANPPEIRKRQAITGPPIPPESQTIITAELNFRWLRKPVKKEIEFQVTGTPQARLNPPAKVVTDNAGKATATLIAGMAVEDVEITATYKAVFGKKNTIATITIPVVAHPGTPVTPPVVNLDQVKKHIKQKIAEKALNQLQLNQQNLDMDGFIRCLFTIHEFTPLPDSVIAALKPNPFANDAAIIAAFAATPNTTFENALDNILNHNRIGTQIGNLINQKRGEINNCYQQNNQTGGRGGVPMVDVNTPYYALGQRTVDGLYQGFVKELHTEMENASLSDFLMLQLFELNDYEDCKKFWRYNYVSMIKHKYLLLETNMVKSLVTTILGKHQFQNDNTRKQIWTELAARAIVEYYLKENTGYVTIPINNKENEEIRATNPKRSEKVLGKMLLLSSFFKDLVGSSGKITPMEKDTFEKGWDVTYKNFFEIYNTVVKNKYLSDKLDYPSGYSIAEVSKDTAYFTYRLLADYFTTKRLKNIKTIYEKQVDLEGTIREIHAKIEKNFDDMQKEERAALHGATGNPPYPHAEQMKQIKDNIYHDMCGNTKILLKAYKQAGDIMWDADAEMYAFVPKKEIEKLATHPDFKKYSATHNKEITSAIETTDIIVNAIYRILIRCAASMKLYTYVLAEFAGSMQNPRPPGLPASYPPP